MQEIKNGYSLQFWMLCLSSYLFTASFNMMIPELPGYLGKLGGGAYKGLIIAAFTFTACVSRPFSGKLTDAVGRIPVMVYGSLVCVLCGFLYPVALSVAGFLMVRVIHGFSTGFKPTGTTAYVSDVVSPAKRGEAMGLNSVFSNIGMASGPILGNYLVNNFSYNHMFYCSSILAACSVAVLFGMKETLKEKKRFQWQLLKINWNDVFEPRVIAPFIVLLLSVFPYGIILTVGADFSMYVGIENKGLYFTAFTLASLGVRFLAGRASDKYGRVPILKFSVLLLSFTFIYIGFVKTPFEFLLASALFGISNGITFPAVFAWAMDLSEPEYRGRAMATVYIALEIGIGLGALVAGFMIGDDPFMFSVTFWIGASLSLICLLYILTLKKSRR